jgi:hypothetical protein
MHPPASVWPEMADIAASAAGLEQPAQAMLEPLGRVVPTPRP